MLAYYELTLKYEQKGIKKLHREFNKQKHNRQTSYIEYSFRMTFCDHSNGLASKSHAIAVGTNSTNANPTINLLFIFLIEANIILVNSSMRRPSGTSSTFSG